MKKEMTNEFVRKVDAANEDCVGQDEARASGYLQEAHLQVAAGCGARVRSWGRPNVRGSHNAQSTSGGQRLLDLEVGSHQMEPHDQDHHDRLLLTMAGIPEALPTLFKDLDDDFSKCKGTPDCDCDLCECYMWEHHRNEIRWILGKIISHRDYLKMNKFTKESKDFDEKFILFKEKMFEMKDALKRSLMVDIEEEFSENHQYSGI